MAIVGYGHQGRAQALCLRDGGWQVTVATREEGASRARAVADGFPPAVPAEAARNAQCVALLVPDELLTGIFETQIAAALSKGAAVVLAHGFAHVYGGLTLPAGVDGLLVSPAAPGAEVRRAYEQKRGVPIYIAAFQDATGTALARARVLAEALGGTGQGGAVIETDIRSETEVDLFGEQAVVVGGVSELVEAAFQTLVDAGYDERLAYLEVVHQLKHLVDVIHDEGPDGLRERISQTALYGALTRGPRVVNETSRAAMANLLAEVRSGAFAAEWRAEASGDRARLAALLGAARARGLARARERALGKTGGPPSTIP